MEPTWLNMRLVAFTCLTSVCLVHGTLLKLGLRLQNTLGALKLLAFALIPVTGILYLAGVKGFQVGDEYEKPNNFTWDNFWEGSGTGASAFVNGLFNVILWVICFRAFCVYSLTTSSRSFIGYSSVNSVLSEVRDPVRTIKLAAPLAVICVATVYFFINISYFAVVSKRDILESKQIVALVIEIFVSLFLLFNRFTEPYISGIYSVLRQREWVFVTYCILVCWCRTYHRPLAPSLHYLLLATYYLPSFTVAEVINQLGSSFFAWLSPRTVIQELGREGILPFSSFFASNRPFNAPLAGLFAQYLVSCIFLIAVPPGDAYIFIVNSKSNISDSDPFKLRFVVSDILCDDGC